MDEFKDIDDEIMRLKEELSAKDESLKQVKFPASGDYWRSRLDEERVIWDKRNALAGEERKSLEKKLAEQSENLSHYDQSIREMERKLENDTRLWEERLRLKEADVLIEKNRLFCETRIKEIEFEKNKLTEQVAELSTKITTLRDEQIVELEKLKQNSKHDAEGYEQKITLAELELQDTRNNLAQADEGFKKRVAELESLKEEYRVRLEKAETTAMDYLRARDAACGEIGEVKEKYEQEKARTKEAVEKSALTSGESLAKYLGVISGFVNIVSKYSVGKSTYEILADSAQKALAENDKLALEFKLKFQISENFKVLLCMGDEDAAFWESALTGSKAEPHKTGLKSSAIREIAFHKPRVAVVSAKKISFADKIYSKWPFLPVIVYGELPEKKKKELLKKGFSHAGHYVSADEMLKTVNTAAKTSVALPEYWDKISIKKRTMLPYAAALAAILIAGGFYVKNNPEILAKYAKVSTFSLAYNQPSNITFDGQCLWACDWYGQAIYKHDPVAGLKLLRIFNFPGKHFTALAWADGYLWSADAWEGKIYKHNTDDNLTILETYNAPGSAISGLAFDGKNMWSCDASAGMIYKHTMDANLTVDDVFESPGASPSGLFFDGKNLWSVDSKLNRISCHRMDNALSVAASFTPPLFDQKNYNLSGIALKGNTVWVCSEKLSKVFSFPKEKMELVK